MVAVSSIHDSLHCGTNAFKSRTVPCKAHILRRPLNLPIQRLTSDNAFLLFAQGRFDPCIFHYIKVKFFMVSITTNSNCETAEALVSNVVDLKYWSYVSQFMFWLFTSVIDS